MPKKRGDQGFDRAVFGQLDYRFSAFWGEDHHRRAIMACLVQGVYRMERDRTKGSWKEESDEISRTTPVWWETFHYGIQELIFENEDERGSFFGVVYHSKLDHNQDSKGGAPKIVVAFRGTMVKIKDFHANSEIILNRLHSHPRCGKAVEVVQQLVQCYGPQSVCLAGHSNGAALALLVGRKLAEPEHGAERRLLEAHLFNPPHPAATISPMPPPLTSAAQYFHDVVGTGLSRVLQDESTRQQDHNRFSSLRDWMPNLYINKHDRICASYLSHFQATQHVPAGITRWLCETGLRSPTPVSIRANAGAGYLIPSARLHINTDDKILKAHKLEQWLDLELKITPSPYVYVDPLDSNDPNHNGEEVLET